MSKCKLFKRNLARNEFHQFPSLSEQDKEKSISDDDHQVCCAHLEALERNMYERFQDILLLRIPDWAINPFLDARSEETGVEKEEIVSLENEIELRPMFKKSFQDFWLQKISDLYSVMWKRVKIYFIAFPTSYLIERGFSVATLLLSNQKNGLKIYQTWNL